MAKTNKLSARKKDERAAAYIFTIPAIALLVAFLVVPMVYTVYYSVFKYQVMRPNDITFIGLANYQKLFKDPEFWKALRNTFYFTIIVVPVQCVLALALALLVSKRFRGVSIFRTMYFSPQLTSMVVISVLWTVLYNSNPNTGLINSILVSFGLQPINFLTNAKTAMNAIIFMSAWQGAGYQMMIFLAGLQGIPTEQYEASAVDGANKWQQFWKHHDSQPEGDDQIRYHDHDDPGHEAVHTALRHDPGRPQERDQDYGVLHLYTGLPEG